jgi:hypothetical protein
MSTSGDAFTQLYAGALDRLGDPAPHQRLGGLHTLVSLGTQYPAHVPAIVDVLSAYIRGATEPDGALRQAALALLTPHLRPGPQFWPEVRLDLAGAQVSGLDLADASLRQLRLDGAQLGGATRLQRLSVGGPASLRHVAFQGGAWLEHAAFAGPVHVDGAVFGGDAWLGGVRFRDSVTFAGAVFEGHAWFSQCEFDGPVDFAEALFRRSAGFRGAVAHSAVGLSGTTFLGPARVSRAGEGWNFAAPGWGVVVDPDNEAVGHLLWLGAGALTHPPEAAEQAAGPR